MKHYSTNEVNEIKREIRKGKPVGIIANELSNKWGRPMNGIYNKIWKLSKQTRKIRSEYTGPTRRPYAKRAPKPTMASNIEIWGWDEEGQAIVKDICEDIVNVGIEELEVVAAEICIEVPTGNISFIGTPSRVVVYSDHVRYYFNN